MAGEFDFIRWIMSQALGSAGSRVIVPPGDDLAVMNWDADDLLIVGVDQVLDGVHFDSAIHSPRDIGRKVMNRNLSDCAAMACLPTAAVATAALPKGVSLDYVKEIYNGMTDAGRAFDCPIIGGDTASWPGKLVLTLTILGRSAGITPVTRSGAKPGDNIYVTGPLGGSILGRHMTFTPRVALAHEIAKIGVNAMIDLSDGLSRDLRHICEQSGVGAIVQLDRLPIHDDARALSKKDGKPPHDHALNDGEDYELLFASSADHVHHATAIGTMTSEAGLWLQHPDGRREELEPRGFEHSL
jgi:thiamine-monophosphate kinase